MRCLRLELLFDRKSSDAFARGGKDRIDQSRGERWHARFSYAAGRCIRSGRHDVDVDDSWRLVNPDDRVVVEIALLYLSVLEANLAIFSDDQEDEGLEPQRG